MHVDPHRREPRAAQRRRHRAGQGGAGGSLQAALEELIEPTTREDGYHTYALHRGTEDRSLFIFYENWTSAEHLDAHLSNQHLQGFLPKIPELIEGDLVINRVRRVA